MCEVDFGQPLLTPTHTLWLLIKANARPSSVDGQIDA